MPPEQEKHLLNRMIKERMNKTDECSRAELELLLKRLKHINGEDSEEIYCQRMKTKVSLSFCQKRIRTHEVCKNCPQYFSHSNEIPIELTYVEPEYVEITDYDENLFEQMSDEELKQLADAMKSVGFFDPVMITPDNRIIYGRERLKAAIRAGLKQIPALKLRTILPEEKLKMIAIMENIYRRSFRHTTHVRASQRLDQFKKSNRVTVEEILMPHFQCPEDTREKIEEAIRQQVKRIEDEKNEHIRKLQEEKQKLEIELKEIRLEYEQKIARIREKEAADAFDLKGQIQELKRKFHEKEKRLLYQKEVLENDLKETEAQRNLLLRQVEQLKRQLAQKEKLSRHAEAEQEIRLLRERIKQMEKNRELLSEYRMHEKNLNSLISFLDTHVIRLRQILHQNELESLSKHLKKAVSMIEGALQ